MNVFSRWYQEVDEALIAKTQQIKLLICDIDGVFSDGNIYMGNDGEELKTFNTKDGFGIKALMKSGIEVAVITGRQSNIVTQRMNSLGVKHLYQNMEDKLTGYNELKQELGLSDHEIGYIGDDYPDVPVMLEVGLAVSTNDAHPHVKEIADYVTTLPGGKGAVRELTDLLINVQKGDDYLLTHFVGVSG